jgi:hypothetical protein
LDPTIGFLNLGGEEGARWVEADCQVLAPLFKKALSATGQAPICEVLFIYCALTEEGKIFGADRSLRDFIRDARASIAVVAMDNSMAAYKTCVASGTQENPLLLTPQDERVFDPHYGGWAANIVMTLNRNGDTFAKFFSDLFQAMHNGQTMPMAFASLAPQIPRDHPGINNVPGTLMLSEVSHIIFASN